MNDELVTEKREQRGVALHVLHNVLPSNIVVLDARDDEVPPSTIVWAATQKCREFHG